MKTSIRAAALHIFIIALLSSGASAQISNTDGATPAGLSPGAPSGSYSLSDFENVNLYNGNLNVSLPLLSLSGRGGAGYTATLLIEQKWRVEQFAEPFPDQPPPLTPIGNWWGELKPGYGPGVMEGRRGGYGNWYEELYCGSAPDASRVYLDMLTRLTFTAADGTEYELLDQQTGGQPINLTSVPCGSNGNSRGRVFATADGSAATFVSDTAISDYKWKPMGINDQFRPSGYLWLRDGTRYRIDNGLVSWMNDRNGNRLTFTYNADRIATATDSLNRQVTFSYAGGGIAYDQINFKGFGGQDRSIKIWKAAMGSVLRSGYALQTYAQLFPDFTGASSSTQFNPSKVSAVELPNGRSYQFRYNSYGELARIELPTGGAMEYDWINANTILAEGVIYRRVSERRLYKDGVNLENKITYSNPGLDEGIEVRTFDNSGTLLAYSKHYHTGSALESMTSGYATPISYPLNLAEGREYQTDVFSTNETTVLKRVLNSWTANGSLGGRQVNPRLVQILQIIEPAGVNLVSKQTFNHDQYNNQTDVYEYGFRSAGVDPLMRHTHTDYFTSGYDTLNPSASNPDPSLISHIRSLPWKVFTYDATGAVRARSETEYDNYVQDGADCLHSFHCPLTARSNISGLDLQFTTSYTKRGNPTAVTNYLLSNGAVTGSITSYSQYDIAGNVVRVLDPRSTLSNTIATTIEYDDRFGTPGDNEARSNSAPVQLAGLNSFAFPTKVINALGHTTYAQFDYYLSKPVNGEDANGVVASGYFNDSLDRPTQIRRAVDTGDENQTTFAYDDAAREITTSSDRDVNGDNLLVSKVLYDKLGRTIESRQYEGGSNYIAVQTQYDALGRAFKTSNPFRPWRYETAVWTTQAFDPLGRVISVTTPDNAAVTTSYSGDSVTVIDQAGKARKSVSDALGRLIKVYEDPSGVNFQTSYLYDVLDNLVQVTQGGQQRFFMYDSLKHLIRARNPEQDTLGSLNLSDPITGNSAWTIAYQYDSNGNLTQKTDARGVVSTYVYDVLNRNTTINYSDTTSINPDVKRFYDGAIKGIGRFWYNYRGGDASIGNDVDHTAIDSYDALGRPLVQRQLFKLNGVWGPTYLTSRTYNRAGAVKTQTYPSGHAVEYLYDVAGRTSSFSGNLEGTTRTYSNITEYSPFGGVTREQFGTDTLLYHKSFYNIRGQFFDTRLSSVDDTYDWNRGRLSFYYSSNHLWGQSGTDNNGNVLFAETWIPPENATLNQADTVSEQSYDYDVLNRLKFVAEQRKSAGSGWVWQQQFKQTYNYDQYGNRTIIADPAQTWGTGINNKQFAVDDTTNRLVVPAGQAGVMSYDNAGNLITDTYTGAGTRTYDAENRMTTVADYTGQVSRYTYDADGKRVRRQVASSQEEWQVYGMDGELLAEYRAGVPPTAPEKEYGYRNGQLLVTVTGRFNVALAANGAVATASSAHTCCGFSTTGAINGNNRGPWGNGEGWNDATPNSTPDWIQVDFAGGKTIDEIDVFSLHDNYTAENTPTETQTFTLYGLLAFDVQYWNGSTWVTVPGGSVTGNNKVWRKFTFAPITTSKIRVWINIVPDSWSRVVEIQAFGTSAGGEKIQWLIPDHLGSPRMVIDQKGTLANLKRHDYLPFGEELYAPAGGRTSGWGYLSGDGVRQQFTSKERDVETGLDYFHARYYSSMQGRFTSPDEFTGGPDELPIIGSGDERKQALPYAEITNPQSINKYQYSYNNPLRYIDPDGHKVKFLIGQTAEERREARGRLMFNLALNERKHFTIRYDEKTKEYTLSLRGNVDKTLSKPHTQAFTYMVQTVRHSDTVRVGISETFQYRTGPVVHTGTMKDTGGGVTLSPASALSGDVEVYLSRSNFVPTVPGLSGQPIEVSRSIVAVHEVLGHARQLIVTGTTSEPDAIKVENEIRTGRGLPLRQP